jgi:hypothetical protein
LQNWIESYCLKQVMKTKPYDEYYRRRHRIVGHYLALQSWTRGIDCVVLDRTDVQRLLKLSNTGEDRVRQFTEDVKPWFKFSKPYYKPGSHTYLKSLFLSRVSLDSYLPKGQMTVDQRIMKAITSKGTLKIERFAHVRGSQPIPSEEEMVSYLALLAAGVRAPNAKVKTEGSQPTTATAPRALQFSSTSSLEKK